MTVNANDYTNYLLALEEQEGVPYFDDQAPPSGDVPTITFPSTALQSRAFMARNPDYSLDYQLWDWIDLSERVRWDMGINIEGGKQERDDIIRAATASFTAGNSDGELSRENPLSSNYGLIGRFNPVWIQNNCGDGWKDRYFGWTTDLPQAINHFDQLITITCKDALDHLLQTQSVKSSVYRTINGLNNSFAPTAWWPLEDGSDTTQFASGLLGGAPATGVNENVLSSETVVRPGQGQTMPGGVPTALVPQLGKITLPFPSYTDTGTQVAMAAFYITDTATNCRLIISDGNKSLYVQIGGTDGLEIGWTKVAPLEINFGDVALTNANDVLNKWIIVAITNVSATDTQTAMVFDTEGTLITSTTFTGNGYYFAATLGKVYAFNGSGDSLSAGHCQFLTYDGFDVATDGLDYMRAVAGWTGEMMHERGTRIAAEEGFSFYCQADESEELGAQQYAKALDVLRDGAKADNGLLFGYKFGIGYRALSEMFNQDASLELDADLGHLPKELRSADNTTGFYNQWTVRRNNGSFSTQTVQGGIAAGDPVFGGEDSFNLATDEQTADLASFLANRDAAEPALWPGIRISLTKNPSLIPRWREMPLGGRYTVDGLLSYAGTMFLDLLHNGYVEFWNSKIWDITLNGSDGSYLQVGSADDSIFRIDSDSSTIRADMDSDDTYFEVATSDLGDLWIATRDDSSEFPFDIKLAGEAMTVSDIDGATVDTFTRTTSNGWGSNDTGQAWSASGGSAGDFATTGTKGTITLPTGDSAERNVMLETVNYSDFTILATISPSATALTQALSARLWFRRTNNQTGYRLRLNFDTAGNVDLDAFAIINNVSSGIGAVANYVTYTPGGNVFVRIDAYGSSIKIKVWNSGAEPAAYALQITDTTFQFGTVGLNASMVAGNTNVNPVISFDDFFITNPQGFTVTRAVNGIVKSHKANMGDKISGVHVRYPLRLTT